MASEVPEWFEPLNERETQIISLISQGHTNREIAQKLSLSLDTIKWYNKQIYSKLGVSNRTQATATARRHGLLETRTTPQTGSPVEDRHNLPYIATSFIGRRKQLAEVKQLLQQFRLLVLTGPGGSGKTRLAIQVAAGLVDRYSDGVWLVELASLNDPDQVLNAIADVLGVNQRGETALLAKIQYFLASRHLLLVLDNFEHLLSAAPLVGDLLASAPRVSILATSRERLHVYGEREYPVHPLELPDLERASSREQLVQAEAVVLFLERARAVRPDFGYEPGEEPTLAKLCIKLDGLPLALELTASWVKVFGLSSLVERLDDRFQLLTGGAHNLLERQRTLRATIDWSYNLLDDAERLLFSRLAVFRNGATLEAVERVCGQDLQPDFLPALSSLVDKSLVRTAAGEEGRLRFRMLETIREYAMERLETEGDANLYFSRHASYYADLAEQAASHLRLRDQRQWFARVHRDYDNLRAALAWSFNSDRIEPGLLITASLRDYWYYNGLIREYQIWTDLALDRMQTADPALQAGILVCAGQLSIFITGGPRKGHLFRQAIDLYTRLDDPRNAAWAKMFLSATLIDQPAEQQQGMTLCQQALETFRRIGDLPGQAQAYNILGEYARHRSELEDARKYYEQGLEMTARTGERLREGMLTANLGYIEQRQGNYRQALQRLRDSIRIMVEINNDYSLLTGIASLSGPLAAIGQYEQAVWLLAAAETQMEAVGQTHQYLDAFEIDSYRRQILDHLGEAAFQTAWEEGSRMTVQQMLALALEGNDPDDKQA